MTFGTQLVRHPDIPVDDGYGLTSLVDDINSHAYAPTTTASMVSRVHKFFAFLTRYRLWQTDYQGLNATVPTLDWVTLVYYVAFLCQTLSPQGHMRTTYASVCACLSAIRTWARTNGRPDPALDPATRLPHTRCMHFCKGAKRRLGGKAMTRTPLAISSLRRMIVNLRLGIITEGPVVFDMISALLLAFFGLLRVSEYTVHRKDAWFDSSVSATRSDVCFVPNIHNPTHIIFTVKVSKTDQYKVGHDLMTCPSADPLLCPVIALRDLIRSDPQNPNEPLFNFSKRTSNSANSLRSMARSDYMSLFNATVHSAGLDTSKTKTHSLRSGGATAMLRAGVPACVIARLGRWKSACWQRHTWASHALVKQAHSLLGTDLPDDTPVDLDAVRRDGPAV